jgi:hypothetical protein
MKNYLKFFVVSLVIISLTGCSVGLTKNKIGGVLKSVSSQEAATGTSQTVNREKSAAQPAVSAETSSTTLAEAIAALNGKHLKDLYRELLASSTNVDLDEIAKAMGANINEVKNLISTDPRNVDWHVIGSILLATSSIDCDSAAKAVYGQFDQDKNIAAAPLISIGDTEDDFTNNVSISLALNKYEECWLKYFPRAQKIGLPAQAAFYENLALTLGSEFTVGAAVLYNVSEHQDWCSLPALSQEKQSYCSNLKATDVIPKMREYYQITDAVTEIKKEYAELYAKTGDNSMAEQYGDEEDSDAYAEKKLEVMGVYLRSERSEQAALAQGNASFDDEYFKGKVRITVVPLREDEGWMGILDDLSEKN